MKRQNANAEQILESLRALKRLPTPDELSEWLNSLLRAVDPTDYAWAIRSFARVVAELQPQQVSKRGPGRPRKEWSELEYNPDDVAKACRTFLKEQHTPEAVAYRQRVKRNRPHTIKGFENLDPSKRIIRLPTRSDVVRAILTSRNLKVPVGAGRKRFMDAATSQLDQDLKACGTDWDTIVERVALEYFYERFPA